MGLSFIVGWRKIGRRKLPRMERKQAAKDQIKAIEPPGILEIEKVPRTVMSVLLYHMDNGRRKLGPYVGKSRNIKGFLEAQ